MTPYNAGWWDYPLNDNPFEEGTDDYNEYEAGFSDSQENVEK